jgi:hypothetical protein
MPEAGGPPDQNQMAARNRRAVRTEDLSEEEIAAIEANEMEPGFGHLDAELDQAGMSFVDVGLDFERGLRARGDAAKGRPAEISESEPPDARKSRRSALDRQERAIPCQPRPLPGETIPFSSGRFRRRRFAVGEIAVRNRRTGCRDVQHYR